MKVNLQDIRGDELRAGDIIHFSYDVKCTVQTVSDIGTTKIVVELRNGSRQESRTLIKSRLFRVERRKVL